MPPLQKPPVVKRRVGATQDQPKPTPRPIDRKAIEAMQLDPNVKRFLLEQIDGPRTQTAPDTQREPRTDGAVVDASRPPLRAVADTTILTPGQATNDAPQEYEPAVIVNRFSGVDRTTSVYMKYNTGTTIPRLNFSTTTDHVNFTGGVLPVPANHTWSGDPILSENPYVSSGAFPKRTYCSGISLEINGGTVNSAVNVWHTDNPGTTAWTLTTIDTATSPEQLDKPSSWVSWHSGSLGYTYVAAVSINGGTNTLRVYRKTTTNVYTMVNNQFSGAGLQSPIITVDANTGYVYLLWINWNTNLISVAQSTNMGANFNNAVTFNAGAVNNGGGFVCDTGGANCVRGTTVIMARPNATDNSIGVVWHRREATGTNTDVFFNSFALSTQTWRGEHRLNDWTTGDQWNPALDPDANGNYMTMWYDRRDDTNDRKYIVYGAKIDGSGNALEAGNVIIHTNIRASDALRLTVVSGNRYIGEYQDLWEWFGTWFGATIYAPDQATGGNGQPDVYLPRIQP